MLVVADALAFAGQEDETAALLAQAYQDRRSPWSDFGVLLGCALRGDRRGVAEVLGTPDLPRVGRAHGFSAILIASCLARVGDNVGALEWLERGVEHGFTHHRFLGEHNRFLAPLRGVPRFEALLQRAREKERAFEV